MKTGLKKEAVLLLFSSNNITDFSLRPPETSPDMRNDTFQFSTLTVAHSERTKRVTCSLNRPSLAGDDSDLLQLSLRRQLSGLPPLVVRGVHHMEDVSELKVQALTGQPGVPRLIVVEQSSAAHKHKF